ncbi:MAG: twin-arginine translocase TatA/TatE family subunit [Chloroflexi bacterium]|nr:twin-arginine translocase TatA/TatE family subunit [Chloroflexota bacterium]
MPRFGGWEIILVLAIVLIVFGVGRLPEIGGAMGKAIREFRHSSSTDESTQLETGTKRRSKKASAPASKEEK